MSNHDENEIINSDFSDDVEFFNKNSVRAREAIKNKKVTQNGLPFSKKKHQLDVDLKENKDDKFSPQKNKADFVLPLCLLIFLTIILFLTGSEETALITIPILSAVLMVLIAFVHSIKYVILAFLWVLAVLMVVAIGKPFGDFMEPEVIIVTTSIILMPLFFYAIAKGMYFLYIPKKQDYYTGIVVNINSPFVKPVLKIEEPQGNSIQEKFESLHQILPKLDSFQSSLLLINIHIFIVQTDHFTNELPFKNVIKDIFMIEGKGYIPDQNFNFAEMFAQSMVNEFDHYKREFKRMILEDRYVMSKISDQEIKELNAKHHLNAYMSYYSYIITFATLHYILKDSNSEKVKSLWLSLHENAKDIDNAIIFRRDLFNQICTLTGSPDFDKIVGLDSKSIKKISSKLPKFLQYI